MTLSKQFLRALLFLGPDPLLVERLFPSAVSTADESIFDSEGKGETYTASYLRCLSGLDSPGTTSWYSLSSSSKSLSRLSSRLAFRLLRV